MSAALCCAAAIAAAFAALYLKQVRPDYALAVTLAAALFILGTLMPRIYLFWEDVKSFAQSSGISVEYITVMIKIIGVAYITQIGADICADAGEKTLSTHVETAGKVTIALLSLPIAEDVFSLILGILE